MSPPCTNKAIETAALGKQNDCSTISPNLTIQFRKEAQPMSRTHRPNWDHAPRYRRPTAREAAIENAILWAAMIKYGIITETAESHAAILPACEKHAVIVEGGQG